MAIKQIKNFQASWNILSNFETFSRIIKQVYGEVEGKKFLSRLPNTYKKIPRAHVWVVP